MKKAILFVVFLLIVVQASAYTYALRKANDTVRIPLVEGERVNTRELSSEINFWLQLNKGGCNNPFRSECRLYKDFSIPLEQNPRLSLAGYKNARASLGTIRVYGSIERVSVWQTIGYRGIKWLNFRAYGHSSGRNYSNYNCRYSNAKNLGLKAKAFSSDMPKALHPRQSRERSQYQSFLKTQHAWRTYYRGISSRSAYSNYFHYYTRTGYKRIVRGFA